jgi:hypothetical protein
VVVGGHPVAGLELVEGLLGVAVGIGPAQVGVAVADLGGEAGVVVGVAGATDH